MCVFSLFPSRQEIPGSPATTGRRKPEAKTPVKKSVSAPGQPLVEAPSSAKADMTTFLQKLRDAAQPRPSWWVKIFRTTMFRYCDALLVTLIGL